MDRVFISYSRRNQAFAARLAQDLSDVGLQVWIDLREIQDNEDWRGNIRQALKTVDFLVACLSPSAIESEWVQYEIATMRERQRNIYPVIVEHSAAALPFSTAINFVGRYEQTLNELLTALTAERAVSAFDNLDTHQIPNPFKGLEAFQQIDAAWFFGREEVIRQAINQLRATNFLAVVGASGSGKSSLVHAGIIPQIRQGVIDDSDQWIILSLSPGAHPLNELAQRLASLLTQTTGNPIDQHSLKADLRQSGQILHLIESVLQSKPETAHLLLVIDQFEEVFTLTSETEQVQFLDIVRVLSTMTSRVHIILTMRTHYFGELSHFPDLAKLFEQDNLLIISEMNAASLVRAIENPVQAVGLRYEAGLVDRLLMDAQVQPRSLPLLQYTLYELFQKRDSAKLTTAAYESLGGIQQALTRRADAIYASLNAYQQDIMRRLLLTLVDVSDTDDVSRRQVSRQDLVIADVPDSAVQAILDLLTQDDSRLITVKRPIGQIDAPVLLQLSHEAFIKEWDKFQTWVTASLADLQYKSELRRTARNWDANERDEAYLLRDERLHHAVVWMETHHATTLERDFIKASQSAERIRSEQEQARIAHERQLRLSKQRNILLVGGFILFALTCIMVFIYFLSSSR
jgi:hypothetical protein